MTNQIIIKDKGNIFNANIRKRISCGVISRYERADVGIGPYKSTFDGAV